MSTDFTRSATSLAEPMGAESIIYLKTGSRILIARVFGERLFESGEMLAVHLNLEKTHLFDAETEIIISECGDSIREKT